MSEVIFDENLKIGLKVCEILLTNILICKGKNALKSPTIQGVKIDQYFVLIFIVFRSFFLVISRNKLMSFYNESVNGRSQTKYAFFVNNMIHGYYNNTFKKSLPIMDNERNSTMIGYALANNNFFQNIFTEILDKLIPTGIPKYLVDFRTWLILRP
ncbi:hypothetical protein PVAND_017410 [Polypedilum vanderplanki]|uniref:Uncharacterized protein n=1 Tax=Polypedilum vanderplanki TaxID=319348 RepID=A0A9J6BIZ0_POLVA|nr:hypothetical protein PVAND_017410 [Polypedilum vanderplanki]